MCGLMGFWGGVHPGGAEALLRSMGAMIAHRGPDAEGFWVDDEQKLALGHRRLAIVDLSPAGAQPMVSACGRYVLAFNGEIYNHLILRAKLEAEQGQAVDWRGHSDTETLLAGFVAWGLQATLTAAIGMFAIALWDRQEKVLTLARDRMGEKPLYYGRQQGGLVFASELKALRTYPGFDGRIDQQALALLLRHNCIPGPYSIYESVRKLPPGTFLRVTAAGVYGNPEPYWDLVDTFRAGKRNPFLGTPEAAVDELEHLLGDAVGLQMMADVPLGAFLSGGVDSSTIVALMQARSSRPVKTFSIGFHEAGYNEAEHAKAVAQHLGTEHTELYISHEQIRDVIPLLPTMYCEPFADSSQIPTFLVAQMARQHVTVALSGDAGDELFGGYNRYVMGGKLWRLLDKIPMALRRGVASLLTSVSPAHWDAMFGAILAALPARHGMRNFGDKIHKGAGVLAAASPAELYRGLVTHWHESSRMAGLAQEPLTLLDDPRYRLPELHFAEQMMLLDMGTYLPDDILCKVDRAAMAVSLETRVPLLDHRVVEFAARLPLDMKLRDGVGKWVLREVLYRHVPKSLIDRPKMGFALPIDQWLRGPLREWAEDLLSESRLRQQGYLDPTLIRARWHEHLSGRRNWQHHLWDVLMFQAWLDGDH